MSSVDTALSAYQDAVLTEQTLRDERDAAQAEVRRTSKALADAAEARHALRVTLDDAIRQDGQP